MGRPKKVIEELGEEIIQDFPSKQKLTHLSIDYPNEGLNNLARKVNEIIDLLNQ